MDGAWLAGCLVGGWVGGRVDGMRCEISLPKMLSRHSVRPELGDFEVCLDGELQEGGPAEPKRRVEFLSFCIP